jgi:hypothetical protein
LIELDKALATFTQAESLDGSCTAYFDGSKCGPQYSFSSVPGATFYPPDSLPSWTGTNSLSTTGSQLTVAPEATVTWSGVGGAYTVTALPYKSVAAGTTATTAGGSISATGTGSTAGATTATAKSGSANIVIGSSLVLAMMLPALAALVI